MKDYEKSFINDAGIEEWVTTDSFGNEVHCYADKFAEVHTKAPICECGTPLVEEAYEEWYCPKCKTTRNSSEFSRTICPESYMAHNLAPHEDFGEYKYMPDATGHMMFEAGAPNYDLEFFNLI